ncbi:MAG: ABC transporter substrate-binding protein [Myxococcales bacterium]
MSQSQNPSNPVELWYSRCGAATASAIAIRKHWLQDEFDRPGTVLRSLRDSEDNEIQDSHYHHKISGFFREGGNIPPIWARSGGRDTVVVGITWLDEYQGILVRKDSRLRSVADLKGKRLGLPLHNNLIDFQRGAAKHGFTTALALAGHGPDVSTYVDLPAPAESRRGNRWTDDARADRPRFEVEALLAGSVDAIFLRFAHGVRWSRDERLRQVINLNDLPDPLLRVNNGTPRPITVDRAFLEQHPNLVARYLAVLIKTARWAEANPQDVLKLLVTEGGAASVEEVLASHGADVHRSFHPQLSERYVKGLELQKNFLRDHGFLRGDFSVQDWVDPRPLRAAQQLVEKEAGFAQPHVVRVAAELASSAT